MQRTSPSPVFYYGIFFLSGINTMLLSVLIPHAASSGMHALPDAQVGYMLAAQFTGQLLGPFLVTRYPAHSNMAGLLLSAITACLLGVFPGANYIVLALYGLGLGLTMTATNVLVGTEALPEERASRIEMLNAFWPLGAACAPLFVSLFGQTYPFRTYFFVATTCAISIPLLFLLRKSRSRSFTEERTEAEPVPLTYFLLLCGLALLAVGVESAISNWSPTFALRYLGSTRAADIASTIFWTGILTGRISAAFTLKKTRWSSFAIAFSILSVLSTLALASSSRSLPIYLAIFAAAFCIAPIYPVVIAKGVQKRGKNFIFFSAGIGSAAFPWAIGMISAHSGSLRFGVLTTSVAAVFLTFFMVLESKKAPA